jgi:aspartyl-tRNA(Asn)/glutamyl-tRNA(Gln) amidotransferase subunit A
MPADQRTLGQLARALAARDITSTALTDRCLAVIAERNPALNAFIAVLSDTAREEAQRADREIAGGAYRGALHGIPVSLKDIIDVKDQPTTAASRVRGGHVARADAPVVTRLRRAGAVIIGKTNLHEFALGTTNEDSAFGPARHPLDPTRSPGGSSGGSAVSVLADMALASIGTDTGGSIRIPSAACGLVGLKPTIGEIPMAGIVPLSSTLDHVGPLCRSVEDATILYDALRGLTPVVGGKSHGVRGRRLGVLRGYFTAMLDPQVSAAFESACSYLQEAGVTLQEAHIPHAGDTAPVYVHIVLSEAASYHAKTLETRADDYTPNVRHRLEMGRYILAEDYVRALRGRDLLRQEVDAALEGCDGLFLPSLPIPAHKIGVPSVRLGGNEEPIRNVTLRLTQLFNVTGHPAITLPCGTTSDGLPIGAQLVGRHGGTPDLLRLAGAMEPHLGPGTSR